MSEVLYAISEAERNTFGQCCCDSNDFCCWSAFGFFNRFYRHRHHQQRQHQKQKQIQQQQTEPLLLNDPLVEYDTIDPTATDNGDNTIATNVNTTDNNNNDCRYYRSPMNIFSNFFNPLQHRVLQQQQQQSCLQQRQDPRPPKNEPATTLPMMEPFDYDTLEPANSGKSDTIETDFTDSLLDNNTNKNDNGIDYRAWLYHSSHRSHRQEAAADEKRVIFEKRVGGGGDDDEIPNIVCIPKLPPLTLHERDQISTIIDTLVQRFNGETLSEDANYVYDIHCAEEEEEGGGTEREAATAEAKDPFLLQLATTAAKVALESKRTRFGFQQQDALNFYSSSPSDDKVNPEVAIQLLLRAAKRDENLLQCHQEHLDRARQLLTGGDYECLLRPLEPCWTAMEVSLRANHSDNERVPRVINVLLGRKGDRATLQFLWGILDVNKLISGKEHDEEEEDDGDGIMYKNKRNRRNNNNNNNIRNKFYQLVRVCFHSAIAHSLLTVRDGKKEADMKQRLRQMIAASAARRNADPAIQAMVESFMEYYYYQQQQQTKKTGQEQQLLGEKNKNDSPPSSSHTNTANAYDSDDDDNEVDTTVAQQECFLEWHNRQTPSLLSSLSLCMNELLFPTLDGGENYNGINDGENNNNNRNDISQQQQQQQQQRSSQSLGCLLPSLENDQASDNLMFTSTGISSWVFAMACTLPLHLHQKIEPSWHRLYSTNSDGFNMSTLEHCLTGYHGPTLVIVHACEKQKRAKKNNTEDKIFGAYVSQPWTKQSSPVFYGDGDCFLFSLQPRFQVMRVRHEESPASGSIDDDDPPNKSRHGLSNYQYFYFDGGGGGPSPSPTTTTTTDSKSKQKYAQGIGVGGSPRQPRFFISACLDECYLAPNDATFEEEEEESSEDPNHNAEQEQQQQQQQVGAASERLWDLNSLEIWGIGGTVALSAQSRHRSVQESHLQKARRVDKAAFLNDFRSGLIESKMFGFHDDIRNRDGGGGSCLLDCHDGGEEE